MIHGIINIYKEKGFTSHDVVAKLRGILKQKKIGHTGTLDPQAEGVLPVALGSGTKLCDMLTDKVKTYRAVLLLGQTTDTQDTTGTILSSAPVDVNESQVKEAIESFIGDYDQIPPMYSALKVNGKKLYELAREGKTVERKARRVEIFSIEIEEMALPKVTMTVTCSKGTYIRTLCHDIGQKLSCGGCMEKLTRTRVGMFELKDSLKLIEVQRLAEEGGILQAVYPVDAMFAGCPSVFTKPEFDRMLYNGNALYKEQLVSGTVMGMERVRVYDSGEKFCGIYTYSQENHRYQPEKMFLC